MNILEIFIALPIFVQIIVFIFAIVTIFIVPNIVNIRNWFKRKEVDIDHHAGCPYRNDKYYFKYIKPYITEAIETAFKIWEIREKKLIDEQMSKVEKVVIKIKGMLIQNYREISNNSKDLRAYSKILDYTLNQTKSKLKEFVIKNHLVEYDEHRYTEYVKETASILRDYHIALLSEEYWSDDFDITRDELYEYNRNTNIEEMLDIIEELLFDLREIAARNNKKIDELEASLKELS